MGSEDSEEPTRPYEMSEEEVWDSLEQLHAEGKIDHVPGVGSDVDPAFTLNEDGVEAAHELLQENDEALMMLMQMAVDNAPKGQEVKAVIRMAKMIRDDAEMNVFRRLRKYDDELPAIDFEGIPAEFYEVFDP